MTKTPPQTDPKAPSSDKRRNEANRDETETQEEKIKREQATKPALMPIGDPAGAA